MKHYTSISRSLARLAALIALSAPVAAQPIPLGSASSFGVLAGSGITIAGAVNSSTITGDIGTFPTTTITGLGNAVVIGINHAGDAITQAAKIDLITAYNTAVARAPATVATELGSTTRTAGTYNSAAGTFGITGILTLDGGGDPNAVFVFQTASTLITAGSSEVKLINGAQAGNVYWQVGSSATIGSASIFKGNILALTAITFGTGANVNGRLLARNSFVQLDSNNIISVPVAAQTITFGAIPSHTACDAPFTFVAPTASSGLAVTLAVSGPATLSGNTLTLTGAIGTVILTASQAGNGSFSAALNVTQTFTVTACALLPQVITFAPLANHTACDAPFTFVAPTSSSGLAVTLAVSGPATVSGNTVTLTGALGTVVLTASQAGNGVFSPAPNVTQSFTVAACAPVAQTITFAPIATHTACDAPFTFVFPLASSGLAVTLAVSGPATVSGNTVTLTGVAGTVVLTATQAGNGSFTAATPVAQNFVVTACAPVAQTITFNAIPAHTACDAPFTFTLPVSTSGLPVALVVTGPATIVGNTVTLTGAVGTVVLTASQAGNANFLAAPNVAQSFVVAACAPAPTAQTISFAAISGHTACDAPFTFVFPTATSNLPVTIAVSGPATVAGNTVTLTGAVGTVVITASQAGDSTFAPAPVVTQTFAIAACAQAAQTITFAAIAGHGACDAPFTFTLPSASSGLPVTLAVTGPATVSGNTVTLTGAIGTVVLTASQAGNAGFAPAPNITQSFAVAACAPGAQAITFAPLLVHTACDAPFTFVYPVASSGLAVTLAVTGPATISGGNIVTLTGATGTVAITASQAGSGSFGAAANVTQSFIVGPCCIPPVITNSPLTATGALGVPFQFAITATGSPTNYAAFNLPPGLVINATTGVISGTPTRESTTFVTLTASNGDCSGTAVLMIVTGAVVCVPPVITNDPMVVTGQVGVPFRFALTASGSPTAYTAFNLPPGLSLDPGTGVISGTPTHEDEPETPGTTATVTPASAGTPSRARTLGPTFVTITAGNGPCVSIPVYLLIIINPAVPLPVVTSPTTTCPATVGTPFDYRITASGSPTSYSATGLPAGLALNPVTGAISGTPTRAGTSLVILGATNGTGSATGLLTLVVTPVSSIVNVSARMNITNTEGTLIVGFVISGAGPKTVLVRGVGPTLASFGVTGVLADPTIAIFNGATQVATNDNWGTGAGSTAAQITSTSTQVGAFALTAGSRDAALLVTLPPGAYTVQVRGVGTATGATLVEVYDTQ